MRRWRCKLVGCMLALAALFAVQSPPALAAEQVDLLLVLSSDVSRSVDHPKFLLQREGYAAAISDPHVLEAIKSGPQQRIAVCFVEWSGFGAQKLLIDWAIIDGPEPARKFGDQLLELPRAFADRTSISGGIEFAAAQLERAPFESGRRAIDVSGDGTNNAGRDVKLARDEAVAKGIVINGLVILSDRPVPWNADALFAYLRDGSHPDHGTARGPMVRTSSRPCSREMPVLSARSSFVEKLPSVQMTVGSIRSTCWRR